MGNTVWTGHGQGLHWSRKVVRVVLEAVEGRINTAKDCRIVRQMKLRHYVIDFGRFSWGFEKMLVPSLVKVVFRAGFMTYHCSLLKVSM